MKYLILTLSTALLLSACTTAPQTPVEDEMEANDQEHQSEWTEEEMKAMEGDEMMEDDEMMENDEVMENTDEEANLGNAQYIAYSETKYKELLGKEPFAIFFHAPWCPVCKGLEKDINAELSQFPKGVNILKADFDTETELRFKYDIGSQSTFVIVDGKGEYVKTLVAPSNEDLTSTLTALL